ncbi:MAG: group I intron-associated PD-(D/E)XK endonuclease [Candidatus Methanoperedens sp.]
MSNYSKGIKAEKKVKSKLEKMGWLVRQSKGSRGPFDLYAMKGGKKLLVQVKSGTASASNEEVKRLRYSAKKKVAKALVMKVDDKNIKSRIVY